jgi:broad specificity phosphatase PhoE
MKIYVVRHGDKVKGEYYDSTLKIHNHPLSDKGLEESIRLWEYFRDKDIDEIYVSRYTRTSQTAEYVAGRLGLKPTMDRRLDEIDLGLINLIPEEEIGAKYPDFWEAYQRHDSDFRYPGGESGQDAADRAMGFINEKVKNNRNLLLFTHEGLTKLITCSVMGIPVYKRFNLKVDTCGILEMVYQEDRGEWTIIRFNHKVM